MDTFYFKHADDETYCLMKYTGREAKVELPDTYGGQPVTIIGDDLLKGHVNVREVHIPSHLRTLGGFVFDGCRNLHEVILPETLTDIWQYAFVRSGIRSIVIPGSVKHIIPFVFKDCRKLRSVVCREGVEKIFYSAFEGCEELEEVIVPEKTVIEEGAFEGCPKVKVTRSSDGN